MPRMAADLTRTERAFLLQLQTQALGYFLDNQTPDGLFLDRQRNFARPCFTGWRSTAATGMGLIAVALASAEPFYLLPRREAVARVARALATALERLAQRAGMLPHFTDA